MIYDFQCKNCATIFEVYCKISEMNNVFQCPNCESRDTTKLLSAPVVLDSESYTGNANRKEFQTRLNEIHKKSPGSKLDKTADGIK